MKKYEIWRHLKILWILWNYTLKNHLYIKKSWDNTFHFFRLLYKNIFTKKNWAENNFLFSAWEKWNNCTDSDYFWKLDDSANL